MTRHYRALMSVPISAPTDQAAFDVAADYAASLMHPGGQVIAGHVELVGEVVEYGLEIHRVVYEDSGLRTTLPPDWKP